VKICLYSDIHAQLPQLDAVQEAAPIPPGADPGDDVGGVGVGDPVGEEAHVPVGEGLLS